MNISLKKLFNVFSFSLLTIIGCSSGVEDLIDLELDPPGRQPIDVSRTGVNNFFVDSVFGTIPEQYSEIRNTLGLRFIRVLFAWTDAVQPTPTASPDYSFYDAIIAAIPPGVDVLVTVVHTPTWMSNPANWTNGDARATWNERWLRPTVARYAGRPGIVGWQVWNEPDHVILPSDGSLELTSADNYFSLLQLSSSIIRSADPGKLIVIAATRSIQQNSGRNLDYNKRLQNLGAEDLVDKWAIHYYGEQFEQVIINGGVGDFIRGLRLPVWLTESGEVGPNRQLPFVETVWPFLDDEFDGRIERFYYYQFGETVPNDVNFGLRQPGPALVSDLYVYLAGL